MIVNIQKFLDAGHISSFIRLINCVFEYEEKEIPAFHLDFSRVERADLLGVLLTYKVLEYSTVHRCFTAPSHNIYSNKILTNTINKFGFEDLIRLLMAVNDSMITKEYKNLEIKNENDCVIAPIALLRTEHYHSEIVIKNKYEPIITGFYQKDAVVEMILEVFTEIMHNFWAHATDEKSIIAGYGNRNFFEIACVDNGLGIDGTIHSSFPKYYGGKALLYAMSRGVTSKSGTNHMGYGLWFINEIVSRTKGTLQIISNKSVFCNSNGKYSVQISPNWHGTIVYVRIPLSHPVTIKDVEDNHSELNEININFI
jgi:hypothetical protein